MQPPVCISIIIPALNEERVIGRCLERLACMNSLDGVEVVVVDNGSRDRTGIIASEFRSHLDLTVVRLERPTVASKARNAGAAVARGEYLAFLDADCLAPADWQTTARQLLANGVPGILGAPYGIPPQSTWVAKAWGFHSARRFGDVPYIPGGDLILRKQDFQSIGGFDETLETNEDYEFCQRALAAGLKVRAYRELMVCHLGTAQSLREFYRKQRWHGKHVWKVFIRSLPQLRNLFSVAFAAYMLACFCGVLMATSLAIFLGTRPWQLLFLTAGLLAPLALGCRAAIACRRPAEVLPLALLFFTFGMARAMSLVGLAADRRKPIS